MPTANDFDLAFGPMDALLGMAERVNILDGSADLNIDGETYAVGPNLCAACGAGADEDCVHKAVTRAIVEEAIRLERFEQDIALEEDMEQMLDHADQQAETYAIMGGVG